ncbi:hypothetical protein [Rhodoferax sp.]|uniref:hypothetical protein n=1 Tax=Rhodoferax sp. TaxID=50421 RepID=UPI00374D94EB
MSEPAKKPRIRVAEAVETGVEGTLLFLVRYFQTGFGILTAPRRTARRLLADRHSPKPAYVLPLTYLSIGLFLLSLMGQIAGTSIFDWIWFVDDLAGKVTDALSKEVSLVKVAVQALPGVLVVAAFAAILRLAFRRAPMSKRLVNFVLSYAFGAQACGLFLIAFGFVVSATVVGKWAPPGGAVGSAAFAFLLYAVILGGLVLSFLGPLTFVFTALRWRRLWRVAKTASIAAATIVIATIFAGHVAILGAMMLPAYVIARSAGPSSPELTLGDMTFARRGSELDLEFSVLLKNRGAKPQGWKSEKLEVALFNREGKAPEDSCKGDAYSFSVAQMLDGAGTPTQYTLILPGETRWFAVKASAPLTAEARKLFSTPRQWDVQVSISSVDQDTAVACSARTLTAAKR